MTPEQEQETREEAERLAEVSVADQQEIIALHRSVADDAKVSKRDRQLARERADSLEKHLRRLNRARKRK